MNEARHIYVDLDGTLIKTDLFFESILKLIKQNPLNIIKIFFWIIKARSYAKSKIANIIDIDAASLPYQSELIEYLKSLKAQGHKIILATASNEKYAHKVSNHLGIFDGVIASSETTNMKGRRKLEEMNKDANGKNFCYAGDSTADIPIWNAASENIFVDAPHTAIKTAQREKKDEKIFTSDKPSKLKAFIKEMRPQQWAKNVLILIPLLTAHRYAEADMALTYLLAFLSFSLCASGVYFMNDLLDIEADRQHKTKCKRPIASGALPIPLGVFGAIMLPASGFAIAIAALRTEFVIILAVYFILTNFYSLIIKRISTADVMTLATLYTLRIVAGGAAGGIELSSWLITFSIFFFVSLAYLKRYIEVSELGEDDRKAEGRGYSGNDTETMFMLGIANATASVLVLALFLSSDEVLTQNSSPEILPLLCFIMLYWTNRIWVGAKRKKIADDPVIFAVKDRISVLTGIAFVLVFLAARYI